MRRRLPQPELLPLGPARTSFSPGDQPAAASPDAAWHSFPRPRRCRHTLACFSSSSNFFFSSEPSSWKCEFVFSPSAPLPLFFSLSSPLHSLLCDFLFSSLFIFIYSYLFGSCSLALSFPPSLRSPPLSPEWRVRGSVAGQA